MLLPDWTHVACSLCPWRLTQRTGATPSAYTLTVAHLTDVHDWTQDTRGHAPIQTDLSDDERSTLQGCDRLL